MLPTHKHPLRWLRQSIPLAAATLIAGTIPHLAFSAESVTDAGPVRLESREPWTPHPAATPVTSEAPDGAVLVRGNGTRTCCGGWQFHYTGVRAGQAYRIRTRVEHGGLANARDSLVAMVLWDRWKPDNKDTSLTPWNYLLPRAVSGEVMDFDAVVAVPAGAKEMTVRFTMRWSPEGSSRWSPPQIEPVMLAARRPVKICVVSATRQTPQRVKIEPFSRGLDLPAEVAESVDLWGSLVLLACQRKPQLIVTPEVVIGGKDLVKGAVAIPGPATRPFEQIAREHQVHLVLGMRQRDGDASYNVAALVSPEGKVAGVYRKVHLATSEGLSGLSAGDSFPVFDTAIGRIGCMICMDTTVSETARMLALNGADFICFPIMGDLRADRWSTGSPIYSEDRWKAIMRTRALDNQLCMVIARNNAQGSCVIDRKGDIIAWNEGDEEVIEATLPADDGYRVWNGGDFREVTFLLRRPHLYGAYTDEHSLKPLDAAEAADPSEQGERQP